MDRFTAVVAGDVLATLRRIRNPATTGTIALIHEMGYSQARKYLEILRSAGQVERSAWFTGWRWSVISSAQPGSSAEGIIK